VVVRIVRLVIFGFFAVSVQISSCTELFTSAKIRSISFAERDVKFCENPEAP
jgi:hypothetical protein